MLRNLRVGTKLAAILLAPLVVLGVLAGVGVAERLDRAADARLTERQAELAARNATLLHSLQVEQLWASILLASGAKSGVPEWEKAATDAAAAYSDLQRTASALDGVSADFQDRLATVGDRLASIDGLRASIRSRQASPSASRDRYGQAQSALVALLDASTATPTSAELGRALQAAAALAKGTVGGASAQAAFAALAANPATASAEQAELARTARDGQVVAERQYENFFESAEPEFRALLRNAQASGDAREIADLGQRLLAAIPAAGTPGPVAATSIDPIRIAETSIASLDELLTVNDQLAGDIFVRADSARNAAFRTVQLYLAGAIIGILAAAAIAFAVARSITRPLRRLTDAARQLSTEQLPALVEQLRSPGAEMTLASRPIDVESNDELGQLARAFNTVQDVTVSVAAEQSTLLRKGISDIFVNLARRNQSLLDRQIEFIDTLEANEQDPDQLENLFRLDHLATRMRRNAESLLVLAGAEPARRRGRPVPLADVVRVAVGEVADYSRISLLALDEVTVSSTAAVDLAHLLAELMDNATQFSPPDTVVEVVGHRRSDDGYVLSVSDGGIGMPAEQLTDANDVLAHPPLMGLSLNRSLGFVVIGRLATRHAVSVRLTPSPNGGVTALVNLPAALLRVDTAGAVAAPGTAPAPNGFDQVVPGRRVPVAAGGDEPGLVPGRAASVLPTTAPFIPTVPNLVTVDDVVHAAPATELIGQNGRNGWSAERGDSVDNAASDQNGRSVSNGRHEDDADTTAGEDAEFGQIATPTAETEPHPQPFSQPTPEATPEAAEVGLANPTAPTTARMWNDTYVEVDSGDSFDPFGEVLPVERDTWADAAPDSAPFVPIHDPGEEPPLRQVARFDTLPRRGEVTAEPALPARAEVRPATPDPALDLAEPFEPAEPLAPVGHLGAEAVQLESRERPVFAAPSGPMEPGGPGEGPGGGELTAAGLVRRSPRQQLRNLSRTGAAEPEASVAPRVSSSQRSPEEVRRMLSRYRSGLQRGRTGLAGRPEGSEAEADSTRAPADAAVPETAAGHTHDSTNQPEDGAWRR